jgi:hypothetical protein
MEKYYVVGLKNDQVARGALSQIADVIRNAFINSSKAVLERRVIGAKENWAVIRFDSGLLLNPDTELTYPDYDEVLYLNQVAWDVFKSEGIRLEVVEEIDKLPKKELGMFISMPIFK